MENKLMNELLPSPLLKPPPGIYNYYRSWLHWASLAVSMGIETASDGKRKGKR